jgi:hypothetical protein
MQCRRQEPEPLHCTKSAKSSHLAAFEVVEEADMVPETEIYINIFQERIMSR